jgi:hypothetical protein
LFSYKDFGFRIFDVRLYNYEGQCDVPKEAQEGVIAIFAVYCYTLALKENRQVIAWGWVWWR